MFKDAAAKSPEFQQKIKDVFETADANKDSLLNEDEYLAFEKLRCQHLTEKHGEAL